MQQHRCISQHHVECLDDVQKLAKPTNFVRSQIIVASGGEKGAVVWRSLCCVLCSLSWSGRQLPGYLHFVMIYQAVPYVYLGTYVCYTSTRKLIQKYVGLMRQ